MLDSVKKFHGTHRENVSQWFDRYEVITEMSEVNGFWRMLHMPVGLNWMIQLRKICCR